MLTNSAFPHLVKIGRTVNSPHERAKELSSTGVPSHFTVAYYQRFEDCVEAEKILHEIFSEFRSNMRREFFDIDAKEAIDVIRELPGQIDDSDDDTEHETDYEDYDTDWKDKLVGAIVLPFLLIWWIVRIPAIAIGEMLVLTFIFLLKIALLGCLAYATVYALVKLL